MTTANTWNGKVLTDIDFKDASGLAYAHIHYNFYSTGREYGRVSDMSATCGGRARC